MKKEKTKPTKKKILTYYLILAACLLVAAAVTVGVIFGVKKPNVSDVIENPPADDKPTQPETPDDSKPNKPVDSTTSYIFIVPVKQGNLAQTNVFCYDKTLDRYATHKGMDFSAAAGTEVLAAVDGTVVSIFKDDQLYNAVITVKHDNGMQTVYKYIDPVETLKVGDKVNRGDVIAKVAAAMGAENMEGDHLHFEVFENGEAIDPDEKLNIASK